MRADEVWDEDGAGDDRREPPYVDFAWGRTANPNTVDGELQNLAAFGAGLARMSAPRRAAAKVVVWLLLLGVVLTVIYGVLGIVTTW